MLVVRDDGLEAAQTCDCQYVSPEEWPLSYYWDTSLADEWRGTMLADFKTFGNKQLEKAYRWADQYIKKWPQIMSQGDGLYLFGEAGNGKTMLTSCIANEVTSRHGSTTQTITTSELMRRIRSTYDDPELSEAGVINAAANVDLLILDDIGAEKWSEFTQDTIHSIIEERRARKKPTLYTSNFEISDLGYHPRTKSRIAGTVAELNLPSMDHRTYQRQKRNQEIAKQQ